MEKSKERLKLEGKLVSLRSDLESCRPAVDVFARPFTFIREKMHPKPDGSYAKSIETVTETAAVYLRQFDGEPGCEGRAVDLGERIRAVKDEILAIQRRVEVAELNELALEGG